MRSTDERDAHAQLPGKVRLHADLCTHAQRAMAQYAQTEGIPHTEALCRLLFFGYYTTVLAQEASWPRGARVTLTLDIDDHGQQVLMVKRRQRRTWRTLFTSAATVELIRFRCPGPHSDNRLIFE